MMRRKQIIDDVHDDLREHIDRETRANIERGMPPDEARFAAVRKFGNATKIAEDARDVWTVVWFGRLLQQFLQDLRFAVRMLRKTPGFAAVAVLTLALGIGANTAIFSVVNSVLLSNLPVRNAQQLVFLTNPDEQGFESGFGDGDRDFLTYPEFQELEQRNQVFSGLLAASSFATEIPVELEGAAADNSGTRSQVSLVSGSYFYVLGVDPILGRAFGTGVDKLRNANPVAVISYSFW